MTIQNTKKETGVSLVRETVIKKLQSLFEEWNDETHKENDSGFLVNESPKWKPYDIPDIFNTIVYTVEDIDKVLKDYLPRHHRNYMSYDWSKLPITSKEKESKNPHPGSTVRWYQYSDEYGSYLKKLLKIEINRVNLRWNDWKDTDTYKEIYNFLSYFKQKEREKDYPYIKTN